VSWSFNATVNRTLEARFIQQPPQTFTITATAGAGGTVVGGGTFPHNASVTLTATPNSGHTFDGWYENGSRVNTNVSWSFNATVNRTLEARFAQSAPPPTGPQPVTDRVTFNGRQYQLFEPGLTWTEAKAFCESLGGHLATITNTEEQKFIEDLLAKGTKVAYWLGGTDRNNQGDWEWITGEPWSYTNWGAGEPNNGSIRGERENYLGIWLNGTYPRFSWNDFTNEGSNVHIDHFFTKSSSSKHNDYLGFICEWPAPQTPPPSQPGSGTSTGASTWAIQHIDAAIDLGIIPNDLLRNYQANITRAEFCRMAVQMLLVKCGTAGNEEKFVSHFNIDLAAEPFTDTSDRYIKIAYALRVVSGVGNGRFSPDAHITRQEAATMLRNAAAVFQFIEPSGSPAVFTDKGAVATWALPGVDFVSANGIMNGTGNNMFSPHVTYTREQAITTMLSLFRAFPQEYYAI
jgi:uncharacterized repeat protein (TIGR02543 family)